MKLIGTTLYGNFLKKSKFTVLKDLIYLLEIETYKSDDNLLPLKYDEIELLEIFFSEPEIINRELKIFKYSADLTHYYISLFISVHDNYILLSLNYKLINKDNLKLKINNVKKLEIRKEKNGEYLYIYIDNNENPLSIHLRPELFIKASF